MDGEETNWSESVEDLVHEGDTDKAISLLESIVSNLQTQKNSSQSDLLKLSAALFDLAKLYSTKGFSLKADEAQSRALLIQQRSDHSFSPQQWYPFSSLLIFFIGLVLYIPKKIGNMERKLCEIECFYV